MHKWFLYGLVASTALYGALSLPICIFALDLSPSDLLDAAAERNGLSGWFSAYVVVSLAAYPALMALKGDCRVIR